MHIDREYEGELRTLREHLLLMAGLVEEMIAKSVQAVMERNPVLAKAVIQADSKVNNDEKEIDELCILVLAKRHPVASDLRFVTQTSKMVIDLERIGDLAVNISERAVDLSRETIPPTMTYEEIPPMAILAQSMVKNAIEAFVEKDAQKAQLVIDRDDEVDELYHAVFRKIIGNMLKEPKSIEAGIHLQGVAKLLERIADHSTNLAEQVIFLVKGEDVRHPGKLTTRT